MTTDISFVVPTFNNLRYVKNAYRSIREYAGHNHEIVILDDNSTDGTVDWLREQSEVDDNLQTFFNANGKLGHTVLYNVGVEELVTNDIFSILHADMFIGPNYVENLLKHLKRNTVVSGTRVEPPLHPSGKEKIVKDFGMWPEDFKETDFLEFVFQEQQDSNDKTTRGIFAPWAMYKEDYMVIGGHDEVFTPYPYEDSDIFQRFILAGYEIVQARDALVYHLTCRGHKWTDDEELGKLDNDYPMYELNARRNWLRKWGSWIQNDEFSYPIIYPKYNMTLHAEHISVDVLYTLEPFFDEVVVGLSDSDIEIYINQEQPNTLYNLRERVLTIDDDVYSDQVEVYVDFNEITQEDFRLLQMVPKLLIDLETNMWDGDVLEGEYEIGNLKILIQGNNVRKLHNSVEKLVNDVKRK